MPQRSVCAVILTKDRPEMVLRAIKSFREQTYENKNVVVLNSGSALPFEGYPANWMAPRGCSIGHYRNMAIDKTEAEIIIHFDDDDLSHPNRIAEQVAHLQASGADVVGYNEVLFWRTVQCDCVPGAAWIARNKLAKWGSTFCFWRRVWESRPFPDQPRKGVATGEDFSWAHGLKMETVSGFGELLPVGPGHAYIAEPRLICSIHGGNSSRGYDDIQESANWHRAPEWDEFCRMRMAL